MRGSSDPVARLIFELSKLPGIGEKTATRLAYFILKQDVQFAQSLSEALLDAKSRIGLCESCFTFTDVSPCRLCSDVQRQKNLVCVVERPADVMAIEQSGSHAGSYHVLHGALSPLDGVGPDDLKIRELLERLQGGAIQEIIMACEQACGFFECPHLEHVFAPKRHQPRDFFEQGRRFGG